MSHVPDIPNFWAIIIGGLLSLLITHWYFRRGKIHQTISEALHENLRDNLIPATQPIFFSDLAFRPEIWGTPPRNRDIPRLNTVIFATRRAERGGTLQVLCSVSDRGWNFMAPSGLTVIERGGRRPAIRHVGFGCMCFEIRVAEAAPIDSIPLVFRMQDGRGHAFEQTVVVEIA